MHGGLLVTTPTRAGCVVVLYAWRLVGDNTNKGGGLLIPSPREGCGCMCSGREGFIHLIEAVILSLTPTSSFPREGIALPCAFQFFRTLIVTPPIKAGIKLYNYFSKQV
jgi:hypothetical protein